MPKRKPYTMMDEAVRGDSEIKAAQVEMLEQVIDEVKRGITTEFLIAKKVKATGGYMISVSHAAAPNSKITLLSHMLNVALQEGF